MGLNTVKMLQILSSGTHPDQGGILHHRLDKTCVYSQQIFGPQDMGSTPHKAYPLTCMDNHTPNMIVVQHMLIKQDAEKLDLLIL